MLKGSIIQAPLLCYPNLKKCYIIYTDLSEDTRGAQLSQEHDGMEFPIAFISHTFMETQNRNPMVYIMQDLNGITTFKELK